MSDDSTRRRFVDDAVAARRAGPSDRLGGDADDGVGTSGKTGGTGGETAAPTGVGSGATADERKRPRRGGRLASPSGASDSGGR
ncbi:hypothetical protein NDI76_17130 [Halogeometricum sp. S1BR25-6]|uniref:Uncharacterized protein n=1 Tax=Halogeometricum salsisoli TaxID=2950536 RepID=A0ABU2GJV8_9EURY|nr:hypothetical protein [Halogeometricum sp. S1BR25-6]MDS0300474.1 hypothetical protein [Halogeometricum sp. S1BR25-6]